jgi:hypothetical protein
VSPSQVVAGYASALNMVKVVRKTIYRMADWIKGSKEDGFSTMAVDT